VKDQAWPALVGMPPTLEAERVHEGEHFLDGGDLSVRVIDSQRNGGAHKGSNEA